MLANWTIDRHLMPIVFVAANATGRAQVDRPDSGSLTSMSCFSRPCRQQRSGHLPDDRELQSSLLFHDD
jgi:hypothetical protein